MKYLVILALGFALGLYVAHFQLQIPTHLGTTASAPRHSASEEFDEKLREWRLTPNDIKQDLAHTGEVVRNQADIVGGKISDERILAVVKAKYILDRDLSANDVRVSVHAGRVTLGGSVGSPDLVGRAVALALDTDGVSGVESRLAISQP
jgi:hypothetical protein